MSDLLAIGEFARQIDERDIAIVAQPIVDLARGTVVGYEALARFPTTNDLGVEAWFALADRAGLGARLEAAALANALALRDDLPPNCFLTANVSPTALTSRAVQDVLAAADHLDGVVIELTEHHRIDDLATVLSALDRLRRAGAKIAIDDAGAGYAGLGHILEIRPDLLKVDRSLVTGLDRDETKRALVTMLGVFADRADAWLLAEGIETPGELAAAIELGVPLGQGWALARPTPPWATLERDVADAIRRHRARRRVVDNGPTAASLMDVARWAFAADHRHEDVPDHELVLLDASRRPVRIVGALAGPVVRPPTTAHADTDLVTLARRMLARPAAHRYEPAAVVDGAGRYLGLVRWERVTERLIDRQPRPAPGSEPVAHTDI